MMTAAVLLYVSGFIGCLAARWIWGLVFGPKPFTWGALLLCAVAGATVIVPWLCVIVLGYVYLSERYGATSRVWRPLKKPIFKN